MKEMHWLYLWLTDRGDVAKQEVLPKCKRSQSKPCVLDNKCHSLHVRELFNEVVTWYFTELLLEQQERTGDIKNT